MWEFMLVCLFDSIFVCLFEVSHWNMVKNGCFIRFIQFLASVGDVAYLFDYLPLRDLVIFRSKKKGLLLGGDLDAILVRIHFF